MFAIQSYLCCLYIGEWDMIKNVCVESDDRCPIHVYEECMFVSIIQLLLIRLDSTPIGHHKHMNISVAL